MGFHVMAQDAISRPFVHKVRWVCGQLSVEAQASKPLFTSESESISAQRPHATGLANGNCSDTVKVRDFYQKRSERRKE